MSIKEALNDYKKINMYPFHMPGHKRMLGGEYQIDMTEVKGVDDLHDPNGIIAEDQERLAKLYGADESYILVSGSTVGNLAAIYATCLDEDLILIQRNSHKSVFNAATLRHLKVGYINSILDDNGIFKAVSIEDIKEAVLKYGEPRAIIITSPSYEGYHCKIKEIAGYCDRKGIVLIVDQAHGAHLGFHDDLKEAAAGIADVVIQSMHKTLPALTQSAVLHLSGNKINRVRVRDALDIFETSSPSYVLMNSISQCIEMLESKGDRFANYVENLSSFYKSCGQLKHLKAIEDKPEIKDPGKIIVSTKTTNISGVKLAEILREKYKIETELSSFCYLLAMTSIMDTKEGFDRLKDALIEIDATLDSGNIAFANIDILPNKIMEPFEAKAKMQIVLPLEQAVGRVSQSMVCLYPPGAPIVVPGEQITENVLKVIAEAEKYNIHVTGIERGSISVVNGRVNFYSEN